MKNFLLPALFVILLGACSPHPGAGIWKAEGESTRGIKSITVAYEGKAIFSSSKPVAATWHCFWNGAGKQTANLDCTPSTNPDAEERFTFTVREDGTAELRQQDKVIGRFVRTEGNPSIR
ncbi:hypothetical protein [Thiolapillus sp.]